jgi:hypothetical protein
VTISSETNKVSYAGNGSTAAFSTGFTFAANNEVVLILRTDSTGAEVTWVEGTEYTLAGAGINSAGTVTVDTSPTDYTPATGETLVVSLAPDFLQSYSLPRGGKVSPKDTLEAMHDNRVRQVLRLKDETDRSLKFPISESNPGELPNSVDRASLYLAFDVNGDPIAISGVNFTTSDTPPASARDGEMWFNTTSGRLYIYYVDVDSGQWVETGGQYTTAVADASTQPYTPAGVGAVTTTTKLKLDERITPANFGLTTVNTPFGKGGVRILAPYTKPTTGVVNDYHYAFGSVIESGTTWTLVYRRGTQHGSEDGTQLRVANSLDLGESWINDRLLYTKATFTVELDVASVVTNGETLTQATSGATGVVDSATGTRSTVEMTGVVGTWDKANSYAVTASVSSPSTLAGTVNDLEPYHDIRPDPLSAMASGRIGFFANRQDTGSYDTSPVFHYSDDDGVTWAYTVEATTPPYTFAAVGGIVPWPASSGGHDTLGFISYGFLSAGDMDAFTTVDNGATWLNSMNVGAASGAITGLSENITVRIGTSDRWLIYCRATDGGGWHDELSVFATTDLLNWGVPLDAGVDNMGTPPGGFYDADTGKVFVIGSSRRGREIDGYTNHMLMVGEDAETLWTNNGVFTESFTVLAAMPNWATGYTHAFETRHGWCLATTAGENQTNGSPPSSMWLIGDFDTKGVELSEFIEKYTRYMNHVNGLEISAVDNVTTNTPFVVGNNAESATTSMGGYEKNVLLGGGNYTDDYSGMATYVYDNDADDSTHFMRGTGTHEYTYTGPVVINFNDTVKWDTDNHWFGGITANIDGGTAALHVGVQGSTFPAIRTYINGGSDRDHIIMHSSTGASGALSTAGAVSSFASDDLRLRSLTGDEIYVRGVVNGAASLYYDNAVKFATTTGGVQLNSGPQWLSGTGTPESAVTASVGSLFSRTDGGASTTLYVKESGAGNTGWIAK